jgi:hypothetical protein
MIVACSATQRLAQSPRFFMADAKDSEAYGVV